MLLSFDVIETTIGVEFKCYRTKVDDETVKLDIWDTAGQDRFRAVSKAYFRNAVGAVLTFALNDRQSFEELDGWLSQLQSLCAPNCVILLVGNKSDLTNDRLISVVEASSFCERNNLEFLETSALSDTNVKETFIRLASKIHARVKSGDIPKQYAVTPQGVPLKATTTHSQDSNSGCFC